jgi:hypothetical protein
MGREVFGVNRQNSIGNKQFFRDAKEDSRKSYRRYVPGVSPSVNDVPTLSTMRKLSYP